MRSLLDFLELRPFFTLGSLRFLWFVFLLGQSLPLFNELRGVISVFAQPFFMYNYKFQLFGVLNTVAYIVFIRLLIEVAMFILVRHPPASSEGSRG
jgi:hypothetical protein